MRLLWPLILIFVSFPRYVLAIDPGMIQGSFQVNEKAIVLNQAYAHLHNNAEGLLDRPKELRILLVDREVPQEALAGISLLAVEQMAKDGRVQGLLLKLDPDDQKHLVVTLLYSLAEPGQPLLTQTLSTIGQKPPIKLKISRQRVSGAIEHYDERQSEISGMPKLAYSLRFSAPLFHEMPVTAVLVGQAAQTSPQMRVILEKIRALEKGDFKSVQRLTTERANRRNRAFLAQAGPEAESLTKRAAAEMKESTKLLQSVVVRGDQAVAIFAGKRWHNFMREGGEWKSDNGPHG